MSCADATELIKGKKSVNLNIREKYERSAQFKQLAKDCKDFLYNKRIVNFKNILHWKRKEDTTVCDIYLKTNKVKIAEDIDHVNCYTCRKEIDKKENEKYE